MSPNPDAGGEVPPLPTLWILPPPGTGTDVQVELSFAPADTMSSIQPGQRAFGLSKLCNLTGSVRTESREGDTHLFGDVHEEIREILPTGKHPMLTWRDTAAQTPGQ